MKLLIADDELSTRIFLRSCATKWGYEVIEAADGLEAMSFLRSPDPPRIAVLDWMMPGLDGVEICSRLYENQKEQIIYTILLTSKSDKEDVMHALDQGAHDFLSKPVHIGELHSRIAVGRRLVEANDRLWEVDRLKDRFMRIAAHDLRNPLGYIMTMTELLSDESFFQNTQEKNTYLRSIYEAASTMQSLISDLLDVAAIKEGQLKIKKQPGLLLDVIKQSLRLQEQPAALKKISIEEELVEDIPVFSFDPNRIRQVLDNLIDNAIKFSPPGSKIYLSVQQKGEEVRIQVLDQGPGLTIHDLSKLFTEFHILSAKPTGNERSIGLGLALVKKIIDEHHGSIQAANRSRGGSVFSFTLPLGET
jgi:two-component system, sensor histidine kinase and response regulator